MGGQQVAPPAPWELHPNPDQGIWDALTQRPCQPVPVNNVHTTALVVEAPGILVGFAFRETSANATTVDILDGRDATGEQLGSFQIPSSGSQLQSVGVRGVLFRRGLTLTVAAGTIKGAVWVQI